MDAVRIGDWASMEVASIDWMPVWGSLNMPLYQLEALRRLRMNRFFCMHSNGNFMSLDDFCEKHNYAMKQIVNHPDINQMRKKSRHLHAASRCAKSLFGYAGKSTSSTPSTTDDVTELYKFFVQCGVFSDNDAKCKLDRTFFACNCCTVSFENSVEKEIIDNKRQLNLTSQEKKALCAFRSEEVFELDDCHGSINDEVGIDEESVIVEEGNDTMSVNSTGTVCESITVQDGETGGRRKLNKQGIIDWFSISTQKFKTEAKYEKIVRHSVKYFEDKMEHNMLLLREVRERRSERIARQYLPHETTLLPK
jgi:hypothetical protein